MSTKKKLQYGYKIWDSGGWLSLHSTWTPAASATCSCVMPSPSRWCRRNPWSGIIKVNPVFSSVGNSSKYNLSLYSIPISVQLKAAIQNKPYLIAMAGQLLFGLVHYGRSANLMYHFKYVEGNEDLFTTFLWPGRKFCVKAGKQQSKEREQIKGQAVRNTAWLTHQCSGRGDGMHAQRKCRLSSRKC